MESISNYPYILHWVWGYETKIPPINLSIQNEKMIFYASGSVGICYDWIKRKQHLLLGHKNNLTSIAATYDKKYLASADSGEENSLIIWHVKTFSIYCIISNYFSTDGIVSMCFSSDGSNLLVLDGSRPQELSIWDWQNKKMQPEFVYKYREIVEFQSDEHFKTALLDIKKLYEEKTSNQVGNFTQTTFSLLSSLAVTATTKGMVILWGRPLYKKKNAVQIQSEDLVMHPEERVCIRMLQAFESKCSISFLNAFESWIIAGTGMSEILFYDENFSVQWSKSFDIGHITGMSFTLKLKYGFKSIVRMLFGKEKASSNFWHENDFILSTVEGYVGYYNSGSEHLDQILWGTNYLIKSVALHPVWPYVYFGDYNGGLQKWNYTTKEILNEDTYMSACSEVELITVDNKGVYAACVMSNGSLVIFDAVCFTSKPCFIAGEVHRKPVRIEFSSDSQHLLIADKTSYVIHYRLHLLVMPEVYQLMKTTKILPEKPVWTYGGKTRQHQGRIVDCMFNNPQKNEAIYFYTLGEDRCLVQYNISNSKGINIDVSKRIILERKPVPSSMTWYPLYGVSNLIAVLSDDNKMRIYSVDKERIVRIVSLPIFEKPIKRIILRSQFKHMLEKEFPQCTDIKEVFQYFIFNCSHMIGMSKYPIDGNPNTSLGVSSTPSGVNNIISNKDHTFLFTAGVNDSWIFMYEINIMAILEAEKEGGEGLDAFKYLFPSNCDPDEMKKKLIYSVYSIELEKKMLEIEPENSALTGEIPITFLPYVFATLGCCITIADLQPMLRDIEFESKYLYNGEKRTLNCLDIMKLYVNYRPSEPVTKSKLRETFKAILASEEEPDHLSRTRFIDILASRGDHLSHSELLRILKCLQNTENKKIYSSNEDGEQNMDENEVSQLSTADNDYNELKTLIPEFITENVFFQGVLCLEKAEEDLSKFILKKEDYNMVQEYPTLDDFVAAIDEKH